ncbi:S-adenosyl-L-methionine-dependent methyltransferases superfamily protein isoform 1 [Hibiscus syriacus]|uniref:S-adenosyl-L-methionine-dependent methyltransferases superfamily protein isoform 1 n=1 Tax=Hibiscus syriacus TaxID=106335 RepID=A0A6A3CDX2_HIBSY|nr:S-adenosyl-L-methionine-dependent methyltransferases superfamily protein isoform 1 [Hibiscus syriacus]
MIHLECSAIQNRLAVVATRRRVLVDLLTVRLLDLVPPDLLIRESPFRPTELVIPSRPKATLGWASGPNGPSDLVITDRPGLRVYSKDHNPKPTRLRSPASSKGTTNFMAPTISAASKINASPRKKVLVERNEPARSSVSFSDIKGLTMEDKESTPEVALKQKVSFSDVRRLIMEDNESTPEVGLNQKVSFVGVKSIIMEHNESTRQPCLKRKNVETPHDLKSNYHEYNYKEPFKNNAGVKSIIMEDNEVTQQTGNVDDSLMETFPEEKGSAKVIPSFEISSKVSVLAPLDADPLMLPYDPKTNYLSPRPQFLHYRQNHRIELYPERDCKQLEECFTTESSSATDVTEETQSEVLSANSPAFTSNLEELSLLNFHVPPEVTGYAKAKFELFAFNLQHWERDDGGELFDNKYYGKIEADEAVDAYELDEEETVAVEQNIGAEMIELDQQKWTWPVNHGRTSMPNALVPVKQPVSTTVLEKRSSMNWQTEMDMASESCPSSMSSFMVSSSYGSFTTYDKIPSKHGGGDEVVTPLRRSS